MSRTEIIEALPVACPSCGAEPCDGRILVGWLPCDCPGSRHGGHRSYECQRCGQKTYTTRHTDDAATATHWRQL